MKKYIFIAVATFILLFGVSCSFQLKTIEQSESNEPISGGSLTEDL